MNEEKLDELLELDEDLELSREIKKKINKSLYSRILIIFSTCFLLLGLIFGLKTYHDYIKKKEFENFEASQNYYNPYDKEGSTEAYEFIALMETSIEMLYPGITVHDDDCSIDLIDEYTYLYKTNIEKIRKNRTVIVGKTNFEMTINRSEITSFDDQERLLSLHYNLFKPNENFDTNDTYNTISENEILEIKELPDSAVLEVAISFNNPKTTSEILSLIKTYPRSLFTWLAVDSTQRNGLNHYGITDGFNLKLQSASDFEFNLNETYPDYCFHNEDLTVQTIENSYISRCQFLLNHEDFLNIKGNFFTKEEIENKLNQAKEMIEENGEMEFIGIYGTLKKGDLLDLIQQENIQYAYVVDVKLSVLQK